jgi:hypothetical protein
MCLSISFFFALPSTSILSLAHASSFLPSFLPAEEYKAAWTKWRTVRDNNNIAVKRSREAARARRQAEEKLYKDRLAENKELEKTVETVKEELGVLQTALTTPVALSDKDRAVLASIITTSSSSDNKASAGGEPTTGVARVEEEEEDKTGAEGYM